MRRTIHTAIFTLALLAAPAAAAVAGPPYITVEVRPYGTIIIRTFHHGEPNPLPLTGEAKGVVGDGQRQSVAMRFKPVDGERNAFTVERVWADSGVWVLNIAAAADEHGTAGATVLIDGRGAATVRYAREYTGRTRPASDGEVIGMLSWLEDRPSPPLRTPIRWPQLVGMALPLILVAALVTLVVRMYRGAVRSWHRRTASVAH